MTLSLELTIYDGGLVQLDGVPQQGMAGAYIAMAQKIYALETQSRARKR